MATIATGVRRYDLFTPDQLEKLIRNGRDISGRLNHVPCAYIVQPKKDSHWLITEVNPYVEIFGYGLFQIGTGAAVRFGEVELDSLSSNPEDEDYCFNYLGFTTEYPISVFAKFAEEYGFIGAPTQMFEAEYKPILKQFNIK